MKKLAINLLKSADEKLRSIGKQHNNSGTVVQTQDFAYIKHLPSKEPLKPLVPQQQYEEQQQQQRQQQQQYEKQKQLQRRQEQGEVTNAAVAQRHFLQDLEADLMADRLISRQGRRDRNGYRGAEDLDKAEIKRRSRSEGPNRRVRQSMEGGKKQTFDGGGRRAQESSDSSDSDRSPRPTGCTPRFDSDSDSDPKRWTKNPLIIRKVKKGKHGDKRMSSENGVASKNRDSWVYYGNEDASGGSLGGGNSSSKDSGSGSRGNKYQKLEEMRKKRLNLSVTSDEENTPASRISRLRQRAIQSGLGDQSRSSMISQGPAEESVLWDNSPRQQQQQQQSFISPSAGIRKFPLITPDESQSRPAAPSRPLYGPKITPISQPPSFTPQSFNQPSQSARSVFTSDVRPASQSFQPVSKLAGPFNEPERGVGQQSQLSLIQKRTTVTQQSASPRQGPVRPPPPNFPGITPAFPVVTEPSPASRAVVSNSPDYMSSSHRVQSNAPKPTVISRNVSQPVQYSHSSRQAPGRSSPASQEFSYSSQASRASPSQFNEVVELRLKTKPQPKISKKSVHNIGAQSEDSLDELIESNIQYLDSEIDKAKPKKNSSANVSRSSSLPDPRRLAGHVTSAPGLYSQQPAIQVQASTSIQFHVSMPSEAGRTPVLSQPIIQVEPSNVLAYPTHHSYESQLSSQPDVVPRKFSYDSRSKISRPASEYYGRDDLSKSDSQLNATAIVTSYLGNNLHPDQAYARGCVSDISLRTSPGNTLQAPQMDRGMFSDVEYDIEVSDRVKKWENFLKVQDAPGEKKNNQNLSTIQENNEGESLMLPSEIRKSVLLDKQGGFGAPTSREVAPYTPPTRPRPFSSDTSINRAGEAPRLLSMESNAHRFFHVVQDPQTGPRLGLQSQSVSSVFHQPISIRPEKNFMSANELRQQMLSNRRPVLPLTSSPMPAIHPPGPTQASSYPALTSSDGSVAKRPTNLHDMKDAAKRGSRYHDELEELSNVKSDSVVNLRRRFDTDSATVTSEDDQVAVSTATARLSRPSKQSPTQKGPETVDWSNVLPGYQGKIKDSDVWSPNLESTQGVPVSIERVTARTLQTIPFSEDPFWKEIEEMTSFDPNSMAGHLSVSQEPVRSQQQIELTPPHSSTLPTQQRTNLLPNKERMQRSKSLYTPNITPLTISVNDKASANAVNALDEVLDDISRSSMERRQMSPKKRAELSPTKVPGLSNAPAFGKPKQEPAQPGYKFEGGQFTFIKPAADSQSQAPKTSDNVGLTQIRKDPAPAPTKQPMQFYQQQRMQKQNQPAVQQNRQSQVLPGNVNSYQLDPDLLKQKLLSTGLVVETDTEDNVGPPRRASLGSTAPTYISYSAAVPTYTPMTAHTRFSPRPAEPRAATTLVTTTQSVLPAATVSTTGAVSRPAKPPGTSALDDIQRALAPFSSGYEPTPESLYGTARLESFKGDSRFDTTRGSHTSSTGWSYQPQPSDEANQPRRSPSPSHESASTTLQQVNESMDDLKDLAQNVERKINVIKLRLQSADEKSLDSILSSLRKVTPEVKSQDVDPGTFEDYYTVKKSKLSEALGELDRIYKSLDFSNDDVRPAERGKYKPYRPSKSSDYILAPQPKSEHLKPMQTRVSSIYVPGLETKIKPDLDKETESEFDIISKSFQAIVDEVNQTTDMFSKAAEKNKRENTAPETQKQTFKITLKPGEISNPSAPVSKPAWTPGKDEAVASTKALWMSSKEEPAVGASKTPPATAPKPQEAKAKSGRFRSKLPDTSGEDDPSIKTSRSKSVPGLDSNTTDLLASSMSSSTSGIHTSAASTFIPATAGTSATTTTTTTSTATVSTPPVSRHRIRARPVKDNKIIQEDLAARRDSKEKLYGMPPSPQPSPKVTRKIIYNNAPDLDVKIKPPQMFQDAPEDAEPAEVTDGGQGQSQASVKQPAPPVIEEKIVQKQKELESKPATVSSPALLKKIPPPTAAKPGAKTEISVPVQGKTSVSSIPVASKFEPSLEKQSLQLNISKLMRSDSSSSSAGSGQNLTSSSASINLTPPVSESPQARPLLSPSARQEREADSSASSGGSRSKRRLGSGVAQMMDKFNTGEDKMKKPVGTVSAPDLSGQTNVADDDDKENTGKKMTVIGKSTSKESVRSEPAVSSPKIKSSLQKFGEKKNPAEGSRSPVIKSNVISSLERKINDPEARAPSSGTSSPQPSSPINKPPQHPWKRQVSDPDRPGEDLQESPVTTVITSPKFVSKIPRPVAATSSVMSEASSSKGTDSPRGVTSPKVVTRRVRPANRKLQTTSFSDRPHSFHELLSCFEKDPNSLQSSDKFRKSASADAVNSQTMAEKKFRSERNLTPLVTPGDKARVGNEVVFKFDLKKKS